MTTYSGNMEGWTLFANQVYSFPTIVIPKDSATAAKVRLGQGAKIIDGDADLVALKDYNGIMRFATGWLETAEVAKREADNLASRVGNFHVRVLGLIDEYNGDVREIVENIKKHLGGVTEALIPGIIETGELLDLKGKEGEGGDISKLIEMGKGKETVSRQGQREDVYKFHVERILKLIEDEGLPLLGDISETIVRVTKAKGDDSKAMGDKLDNNRFFTEYEASYVRGSFYAALSRFGVALYGLEHTEKAARTAVRLAFDTVTLIIGLYLVRESPFLDERTRLIAMMANWSEEDAKRALLMKEEEEERAEKRRIDEEERVKKAEKKRLDDEEEEKKKRIEEDERAEKKRIDDEEKEKKKRIEDEEKEKKKKIEDEERAEKEADMIMKKKREKDANDALLRSRKEAETRLKEEEEMRLRKEKEDMEKRRIAEEEEEKITRKNKEKLEELELKLIKKDEESRKRLEAAENLGKSEEELAAEKMKKAEKEEYIRKAREEEEREEREKEEKEEREWKEKDDARLAKIKEKEEREKKLEESRIAMAKSVAEKEEKERKKQEQELDDYIKELDEEKERKIRIDDLYSKIKANAMKVKGLKGLLKNDVEPVLVERMFFDMIGYEDKAKKPHELGMSLSNARQQEIELGQIANKTDNLVYKLVEILYTPYEDEYAIIIKRAGVTPRNKEAYDDHFVALVNSLDSLKNEYTVNNIATLLQTIEEEIVHIRILTTDNNELQTDIAKTTKGSKIPSTDKTTTDSTGGKKTPDPDSDSDSDSGSDADPFIL